MEGKSRGKKKCHNWILESMTRVGVGGGGEREEKDGEKGMGDGGG